MIMSMLGELQSIKGTPGFGKGSKISLKISLRTSLKTHEAETEIPVDVAIYPLKIGFLFYLLNF